MEEDLEGDRDRVLVRPPRVDRELLELGEDLEEDLEGDRDRVLVRPPRVDRELYIFWG